MWKRPTRALLVLAAAALGAGGAGQAEKMALSVSPPLIEMAVAQGGDRSLQVTLTNDGDKAFEARAEVVDLILDEEGNPVVKPAGTSRWSLARWVTLSNGQVSVLPGQQKTVRYRVRVPLGQSGGRYGAVLFTAERNVPLSGSGMRFETRTGTVVMLTVAHTERRKAEVSGFRVQRGEGGDLLFEITLRNTGNAHLRASGELLVRDATSNRVLRRVRLEGGTGTVLPEGTRRFSSRVSRSRIPPGAYRAQVRFSAPGLSAVAGQTEFDVREDGEIAVKPSVR